MNKSSRGFLHFGLGVALLPTSLLAQTVISGGGNYISGGSFYLGTHSGSASGLVLTYDDAAADGVKLHANRIASWLWENYDGTTTWPSMRLDQSNDLILYNGTNEAVKLDPLNLKLTLGGASGATLTANGTALTTNGALTVAGNFTNTNGSFTGGASGLSLNAGGTNQNLTLNSSGSGDLVFNAGGAERARIKSSGAVGIGTSTPGLTLDVNGPVRSISGSIDVRLQAGAAGAAGMGSFSNDPLLLISGATEKVRIGTNGNVGIGTTAPGAKLDVSGGAIRSNGGVVSTSASAAGLFAGYGGGLDGSMLQMFALYADTSNGLYFDAPKDAAGNKLDIQFNWRGGGAPGLFMKGSTGNVGIGTSTPGTYSSKLEIVDNNSSVRVSIGTTLTSGYSGFQFLAGGNFKGGFYRNGATDDLSIYTAADGSNPRIVVNSTSGNVGIGTTSPGYKLDVRTPGSTSSQVHIASTDTDAGGYLVSASDDNMYLSAGAAWNGSTGTWVAKSANSGLIGAQAGTLRFYNASGATVGSAAAMTERMRIDTNGNVGIGTTSPAEKLQVAGNAIVGNSGTALSPYTGFAAQQNTFLEVKGNPQAVLGIPVVMFSTGGRTNYRDYGGGISWASSDYATDDKRGAVINVLYSGTNYTDAEMRFSTRLGSESGVAERMRITPTGNVGIGTSSPTHKLAVKGTIRANEVIVDTGWADYVFDDSYRLAPLSEVEQHIKAEKHLPGIPSAAEVAAHGVSMGDMQAKLLSKVEELTLHLIAQEKAMSTQQSEISSLRREVAELRSARVP